MADLEILCDPDGTAGICGGEHVCDSNGNVMWSCDVGEFRDIDSTC